MNDNEILEFEDRAYVSPTVSRDEQLEFIDNYRNVLNSNVERINTQTHNLGTDVPSNLGGLTGAEATFETRYVDPQAETAVAELRAKAQETALTQSLNNLQAQENKRYKDTYRNARIKEYNNNKGGGGGGGGDGGLKTDTNEGDGGGQKVSTDGSEKGEYKPGRIYPVTNSVSDYQDANGQWWQLGSIKQIDQIIINGRLFPPKNEETFSKNGVTYIYIDNDQLEEPTWFRATPSAGPGTYSPKE